MSHSISFLCLPLGLLVGFLWRELQASRGREAVLEEKLREAQAAEGERFVPHQLNSHFLFNALNTIRYFVRTNASAAREMLLDLSLVLQSALRKEDPVNLRDELESGRAYLRLEQARLGKRLELLDRIGEEDLDLLVSAQVLPQLLQALVNGVAARSSGGAIQLEYRERTLFLEGDGQAELPVHLRESLGDSLRIRMDRTTRLEWRVLA